MGAIRRTPSASVRFARKLRRAENGCLLWTGAVGTHGYGNFWTGTQDILAHRFAWEQVNGEIPSTGKRGNVVLHTCDNKLCCDPKHLRIGSHADNHLDCRMKSRGVQYVRKLCNAEVRQLFALLASGKTQQHIATILNVHQTTVSRYAARGPQIDPFED